ncbi:membrane protein [Virgisporangium aliadipatigenens]|uniref:Membrane protein n=1 Tax=Virgisporangium aliadipatigenens TaxID=741659 RepID=A0A8J3YP99_9ACTN|nr:membrane protein [Virgisporangium aliadipatigenens]
MLIVPAVVPLLMFLYNSKEPRLFGFPFFYWLQLSFILLSVATTVLVYRMTSAPKGNRDVA